MTLKVAWLVHPLWKRTENPASMQALTVFAMLRRGRKAGATRQSVLLFFVFFGLVSVQLHPSSCRRSTMCFLRMYIIHLPRTDQIRFT